MKASQSAKLKMNGRKFKQIWVTVVVLILAIAVALTVAGNSFSSVLDSFLGGGQLTVRKASGTNNWDSNYYTKTTGSMKEAKQKSYAVSEAITDEGMVMLKNDGVLPLKEGSSVTPFGDAYLNPAYSGSGAAATSDKDIKTSDQALKQFFKVNQASVDAMKSAKVSWPKAAPDTPSLSSDKNSVQAILDKGKAPQIHEYDPKIYSEISDQVKNTTGIVYIKREGSEGIDKRTQPYDDGTPHYLALTRAEKETIKYAKNNCSSVVVVLNTANPMELSPLMGGDLEANAIIWAGITGSRGFDSLSKILCGRVNPSGRLTDIYASDFTKDPTFANFGEFHYNNSKVTDQSVLGKLMPGTSRGTMKRPFVEYEEGIYVGYRYYETAAVEDPAFVYGTVDGAGHITQPGSVTYPFGYGLSYTGFKRTLKDVRQSDHKIRATVEIQNTGAVAGKDVVQLYFTSPYTDYDRSNHVEKSATQLGAFAKTKKLNPGEKQDLELEFNTDDMASYDYHHRNSNKSTGAYILEKGDYAIQLKNNSHDVIDTRHILVNSTQVFEVSKLRQTDKEAQSSLDDQGRPTTKPDLGRKYVAPSNEFPTLNDYMDDSHVTQLSRSNWTATFPTTPKNREEAAPRVALEEFNWFDNFDPKTDKKLGNVPSSVVYHSKQPKSNAEHKLALIDLRGESYASRKWDQLLDQIDWKGDQRAIKDVLYKAAYQTAAIPSIDKPATVDKDGPTGWSIKGASAWGGANLIASSWNTALLKQMGEAIGEEGLQAGLTGWYGPGVNMHRSPFAGRVYEFYSEDALLSGKLASAAISGAGDKGLFSCLKHFALNDQETFRDMYLATWANEQAVREIYLRPFEIAVEQARSTLKYDQNGHMSQKIIRSDTGIMSAQNSIGGIMGFAHSGLLEKVLRGEWNFHGSVITDLYPTKQLEFRDMTLRSGNDMYMSQLDGDATDYDSPTARVAMRVALHNVAYTVVNSNAMNGITPKSRLVYSMSWWKKLLYGIDVALLVISALIVLWIVKRGRDEKLHPSAYRPGKTNKARV